jgi:hypothetical protein
VYCRECLIAYRANYQRVHGPQLRRRRKYGVTASTYARMVAAQGGHCAICGGDPQRKGLVVDHDHATGRIRALLCTKCNAGLGFLRDDEELVRRAATYLRTHRER